MSWEVFPRYAAQAVFAAVVYRLWLSTYLEKWRWSKLLTLLIGGVLALVWELADSGWTGWPALFYAGLSGVLSVTAGVFGQAALTEIFGEFGVGPASKDKVSDPQVAQIMVGKMKDSTINQAERDIHL